MSEDLQEVSWGALGAAQYDTEDALESLDDLLSNLGVDRRTAMPDDEESAEYRLRRAYALIESVKDDAEAEAERRREDSG